MSGRQRKIIVNLIDWSESFVDPNGSFYCGTTLEQKENSAKIVALGDLVISNLDLHPVDAPEHAVNGGLYPVHNAVLPERYGPDFIYFRTPAGAGVTLGDKTVSPRLTRLLADAVKGRRAGMIVPRDVYFQGRSVGPFCSPAELEQTFGLSIVSDRNFLRERFAFITAPKKYFDATRSDNDIVLPQDSLPGIPGRNFNIYSLLGLKFPADEYDLIMINTGVVEGICRLHTSIGLKQMFPLARIINISDATTPLFGVGLGFQTEKESRQACMQICRDIGVEYLTTGECLEEFTR